MNTTSLLVDILIVGIQVLLWILLFICAYLIPIETVFSFCEKFSTIAISLAISISYTLGIIFDYIIANFFTNFKSKEELEAYRSGLVIGILDYDKEIQKFLDNQYARLRIARATVFNIPFITLGLCSYIFMNGINTSLCPCSIITIIFIGGVVMTLVSIYGWKSRNKNVLGIYKRDHANYGIIKRKTANNSVLSPSGHVV